MTKTLVLHHDDSDGYASALALYQLYKDSAEYVPVQYGQAFPAIALDKDTVVFVVDFSYPKQVLENIREQVASITVIDHHETARDQLSDLPYAVFDMNKSGATLTWEHVFPGVELPELFKLVEDRDLWRFSYHTSKAFEAGINASGKAKMLTFWNEVLHDSDLFEKIIMTGAVIVKHQEGYIKSFKKSSKYKIVRWKDCTVAFYNTTYLISELGDGINLDPGIVCDFCMSYFITSEGKMIFSLRSTEDSKVNVASIAKSMGGGGHCNAAGFSLPLEEGFMLIRRLYSR